MISDKIFRHEWTDTELTGWTYRLDLIAPSTNPQGAMTIVDMPIGSIQLAGALTIDYDKYPIGAPAAPLIDVEIFPEMLESAVDYFDFGEFLAAIFNPIVETDLFFTGKDVNGEPITWTQPVNLGIIVNLYCDFAGNRHANTGTEFVRIFTGIYNELAEIELAQGEDEPLKFTAVDVNYSVLSQLQFKNLDKYHTCVLDGYFYAGLYPCLELYDVIDGVVHTAGHRDGKWIHDYQRYLDYVNEFGLKVYRALTREGAGEWSLTNPGAATYYKQSYDGAGTRGAALALSDLKVISGLTQNEGVATGGLDYETDNYSLPKRYKNSVWDYITDYAEGSVNKVKLTPNGVKILGVYDNDGAASITIDESVGINSVKFTIGESILTTVEASIEEAVSDGTYKDASKATAAKQGTRNKESFTAPVVWNNAPACVDYVTKGVIELDQIYMEHANQKRAKEGIVHRQGLYYVEEPPNAKESALIRVHEFVNYNLGDGVTTESLLGFSAKPRTDYNIRDDVEDFFTDLQFSDNGSSAALWLAKTILKVFGEGRPIKATVEIDINAAVNLEYTSADLAILALGGTVSLLNKFHWLNPCARFNLDFAYKSYFGYDSSKYWYPTKTSVDFSKGIVEIDLLLRTV